MAKNWKAARDKRDGKTFVALPHVVIDSPGFRAASHTARSLLVDVARQYTGHNNGKLTACRKYLEPMGWRSNDVIVRARRELIDCRLILETRKGARPNRAAWYALTWLRLDVHDGLEIDPKLYRTGGYMRPDIEAKHGTSLGPSGGATVSTTAPRRGPRAAPPVPSGGAMRITNCHALHRATDRI